MDRDPTTDRLDLGALDPRADAERWASLVRRVNAAAEGELARRAAGAGWSIVPAQWARPILAGAVVLVIVSLSVLRMTPGDAAAQGGQTIAEALGIPTPVAEWLTEERSPVEDDLLLALERRERR
jgi:hypothetical protein